MVLNSSTIDIWDFFGKGESANLFPNPLLILLVKEEIEMGTAIIEFSLISKDGSNIKSSKIVSKSVLLVNLSGLTQVLDE